jgi:hypothetical protein
MPRIFNSVGPCLPEKHYLLSPIQRCEQIGDLIDGEYFFVLRAARHMGKTTLIRTLSRKLTADGKYTAITVSLESFSGTDLEKVIPQVLDRISEAARDQLPSALLPSSPTIFENKPLIGLRSFLSDWSRGCLRPVVIFFDEVDALEGEVLISVLRQLHDGYSSRPAPFPQSIVLVGAQNVREYKMKNNPDSDERSSGPFNIKVRSLTLQNFTQQEVEALLSQHTYDTGQQFSAEAIKEIYDQTRGQPWLVNALAGQLCTDPDALARDRLVDITPDLVRAAREILIERRDTHLDNLVARLQEGRVRRVIEPMLTGELTADPTYDEDFAYVRELGLVMVEEGVRKIANPIYEEIIVRVLTHQTQTGIQLQPKQYIEPDGTLNIEKLLADFVVFWRRNGEALLRGASYMDAVLHLVFMAFLQRVINASGRINRILTIGTGQAGLIVELGGRHDIFVCKLYHGKHTLPEGVEQVVRYAHQFKRDVGCLLVYDPQDMKPWEDRGLIEQGQRDGVTIMMVRV